MEQSSFKIEFLGEAYQASYITDLETAKTALAHLSSKKTLLAIDTETMAKPEYKHIKTAALSPHLSTIRLIQIFDGVNSVILDMLELKDSITPELVTFLESNRFIGHNSTFDLQYFMKLGVETMNIGCTLLLARLIVHATRPMDMGLSLEELTKNVLKADVAKKMGQSDWSVPNLTFEQIEYAAYDPIYVRLIAEGLAPGLEKYGLQRVYKLYKDCQHPVAAMQLNGLGIDAQAHEENIELWRDELYNSREEILKYTKLSKLTPHTLATWLSDNLEAETLAAWPKTEKGKLKTDAHTFADFSHVEIASMYNEYQKKDKLINSFGDNLLELINPETKRLHASYRISGARTGRMSCSSPNLQQLPRDEKVRNIFIPAKEEHVFVSADFSQIELRCAAEISGDQEMLRAYKNGIDLHALTASAIARKPLEKVTKDERQRAKAFNFGLLFGLGASKFSHYARMAYRVDVSKEEAIKSIEIWRELYSGYREWQKEQAEKCENQLFALTVCGKRQRLTSDNFYGTGLNHPVQGTAAEVMMHSLIRFHSYRTFNYDLVNCVHDEITVQVHKRAAEDCKALLEDAMLKGYLDVFPHGITLGLVEAKIGDSWGAVK